MTSIPSAATQQTWQVLPRVQFRQMTEIVSDAGVVEELAIMTSQSRAMMNREGEAHLLLQQSIEAVATELIRGTYITATSLQRLAQDGENHKI
eukprot:12689040-Prorocentrum_lima.AAC.1